VVQFEASTQQLSSMLWTLQVPVKGSQALLSQTVLLQVTPAQRSTQVHVVESHDNPLQSEFDLQFPPNGIPAIQVWFAPQ
jgi:hypothetical protein